MPLLVVFLQTQHYRRISADRELADEEIESEANYHDLKA
jgi:hypothetical protein